MKKINTRQTYLLAYLSLVLLVFLAGASSLTINFIENNMTTTSLRMDVPLTAREIDRIESLISNNTLGIEQLAYWRQSTVDIESSSAKRKGTNSTMLECFGNADLVFYRSFLIGNDPSSLDEKGCSISAGLANAIWGSTNVIGLPIVINKEDYIVRGVWYEKSLVVLTQKSLSKENIFTNIELLFSDQKNGHELGTGFIREAKLGNAVMIDGSRIVDMLSLVGYFPLYLLGLYIFIKALFATRKRRDWKWIMLLVLLCIITFVFTFGLDVSLPQYLIPTKWSDFSFWGRLFTDFQLHAIDFLSMRSTIKDLSLQLAILRLFVLISIHSIVLTAYMGVCANPRSCFHCPTQKTIYISHGVYFCMISILLSTLPVSVTLFYLPCFNLVVRYILSTHGCSSQDPRATMKDTLIITRPNKDNASV